MSDAKKKLKKKLRHAKAHGWIMLWGLVQVSWMRKARIRMIWIRGDAYAPRWVNDLYLHLLPNAPPATEEHLAPMFALGRALGSGALVEAVVDAAYRLGGPEAVADLAREWA